jgi:putative ABC transport system permease protein
LLGCFFAVQFPFLVFLICHQAFIVIAMLLATFLFTTWFCLCSYIPGKQAASIHPAVALHEE